MERSRAVAIAIAAALVLAGAAAWLTKDFLGEKVRKTQEFSVAPVIVAAQSLEVGTKLTGPELKSVNWPRDSIPAGSFQDPAKLSGRQIVRHVGPGEAITEAKLLPEKGAGAGVLTFMIPEGHRAVTVRVDEVSGVAGFVVPGNRVDVIVTTTIPGRDLSVSKIILQNVPVLATGQLTEQKDGKPTPVPTVTLDLVPDDAEKIALASQKGVINLILRHALDVASVTTPGETVPTLLNMRAKEPVARVTRKKAPAAKQSPAPAPQPAGSTIEIIRGNSRSTKQFSE